jgi:hypothetical protein
LDNHAGICWFQDRGLTGRSGFDFDLAFAFVRTPQFKRPFVGGKPILVEIGDEYEASVELRDEMLVEIYVHRELAAGLALMQAAIVERRVGNESIDASNLLPQINEDAGMYRVEIDLSRVPSRQKGRDPIFSSFILS